MALPLIALSWMFDLPFFSVEIIVIYSQFEGKLLFFS